MKKILSAFVLMVLVWGCAKKITPANTNVTSAPSKTETAPAESSNKGEGVEPTNPEAGTLTAPKETEVDAAAVAAGQSIYKAKCGTCHALKSTGDFTAQRWIGIMDAMAPNARLTDIEKANVYTYVKANAKK